MATIYSVNVLTSCNPTENIILRNYGYFTHLLDFKHVLINVLCDNIGSEILYQHLEKYIGIKKLDIDINLVRGNEDDILLNKLLLIHIIDVIYLINIPINKNYNFNITKIAKNNINKINPTILYHKKRVGNFIMDSSIDGDTYRLTEFKFYKFLKKIDDIKSILEFAKIFNRITGTSSKDFIISISKYL